MHTKNCKIYVKSRFYVSDNLLIVKKMRGESNLLNHETIP